jgi:hypothetical protein
VYLPYRLFFGDKVIARSFKVAQNEPKSLREVAQFEPKSLAQ